MVRYSSGPCVVSHPSPLLPSFLPSAARSHIPRSGSSSSELRPLRRVAAVLLLVVMVVVARRRRSRHRARRGRRGEGAGAVAVRERVVGRPADVVLAEARLPGTLGNRHSAAKRHKTGAVKMRLFQVAPFRSCDMSEHNEEFSSEEELCKLIHPYRS